MQSGSRRRLEVRKARLDAVGDAASAQLSYYPPNLAQPVHEHDSAHVSMVVFGGFEERIPSRCDEMRVAGETLERPIGARHGVRFGPLGALIINVQRAPDHPARLDLPAVGRPQERPAHSRAKPIPPWLIEARRLLQEQPTSWTLENLAARLDVHRVHFSRQFLRYFGESPSVTRQRAMAGQALALVFNENQTLASSALAAGFADQAHFTRVFRRLCGLSPGRVRALLA